MTNRITIAFIAATAILVFGVPGVAAGPRDDAVAVAKALLADRHHVSELHIQFTQAHPGTWADSSLGCPEKGVQYAKVITPGFEVKILTDEATYVVHVAGKNAVMCERLTGRDRDPRSSRGEQTFEVLDQAKADLSKRAGIAPETMRIAGITRTHWASADFDCSTTGSDDPNGGLPGYIIRLSSGDDVHVYRADHFRIIYCGQ